MRNVFSSIKTVTGNSQTRKGSIMNERYPGPNKSGFNGVFFNHKLNKYMAKININGRWVNLGTFETAYNAALTYDKAVDDHELNYTKNFDTEGRWLGEVEIDEILNEL